MTRVQRERRTVRHSANPRGAPRQATSRAASRTAAAGLLMTIAFPAAGQPPGPEGMVAVRRASETGEGARLLGFVADAAGHVVAQVVADDAGRVVGADFVVRLDSGTEVAAQGVAYDAASGLGLLYVTADPPPAPYPFARDPAEPGRAVYGVALDADARPVVRPGAVSRIEPAGAGPATIRHNALARERRHGAPLFNNCGQVVGVIVERAGAPPGDGLAAPAEWLETVFGGAGLAPVRVDEACLSEAERAAAAEEARREAERQAADAEASRAAAEEALRAAEAQAEAAEVERAAEAERDRAAAAEALRAAEARAADAEQTRILLEERAAEARRSQAAAELARAAAAERAERLRVAAAERERQAAAAERERQAAAERARRNVLWAVAAGGGLSALLLGLWLAARRSRARAAKAGRAAAAEAAAARAAMAVRAEAERAAAAVPDIVLTGADPDGRPISLRVPGRAAADPAGAVVGRSPFEGEVVLNHPEVSRRHFRLFRADGALMVEDLGSMNGTALDGAALAAGAAAPLAAGARLRIGQIEFTVQTPAGAGGEGDVQ